MRSIRAMLLAGTVLAFAITGVTGAFAHGDEKADGHHKMETAKTVTLEGEVLDMYCYMKHPANGQGPDHAKCARNCIKKGLPIGFLVGDDVYVVVGKEHESAADAMAAFAGQKARLKGKLMKHNGVMAIELESIEKL